MNIKKTTLVLLSVLAVCIIALTGCNASGKKVDKNILERWAFCHEKDKAVLVLYKDGKASFNGTDYKSYEVTDTEYRFTAEDGTVTAMRYYDGIDFSGDERRYICIDTVYELVPDLLVGELPIIGYWEGVGKDAGLSFQFTDKGTFFEDATLPGHYNVEGDVLHLSYDGYMSGTDVYYTIDGDKLTLQYPWGMVKMP